MMVKELQTRIKAAVWQAIASENVNLSNVPKSALEPLIDLITDTTLVEVDSYLQENNPGGEFAEMMKESDSGDDVEGEEMLWRGRPFLSIGVEYIITSERIRIIEGLLSKSRWDVELVRVQDMDQSQTLSERMFNLGDILIRSHDGTHPQFSLNNIRDPQRVHEILRRAVLNARERYRLYYREEM